MRIDITKIVFTFRDVICASWGHMVALRPADEFDSFVDDWLQANWERLVESSVSSNRGFALEVYGVGADCNSEGSRVWRPSLTATHKVIIKPTANSEIRNAMNGKLVLNPVVFSHFCSLRDGWPDVSPPFDYVAFDGAEQAVTFAENIEFWTEPL